MEAMEKGVEDRLVELARKGDKVAFSKLVTTYREKIYNFCFYLVSDKSDALDITQDVFFNAYRSIKRFKANSSFYTWLLSIARNRSADFLRRRKPENIEDIPLPQPDNTQSVDDGQLKLLVRASVDSLPAKYREVLVMRFYGGLKFAEMSELTGENINTLKTRFYTALEHLRKRLRRYV